MEEEHPDKSLKSIATESGRSDTEGMLKAQRCLTTYIRECSEAGPEKLFMASGVYLSRHRARS